MGCTGTNQIIHHTNVPFTRQIAILNCCMWRKPMKFQSSNFDRPSEALGEVVLSFLNDVFISDCLSMPVVGVWSHVAGLILAPVGGFVWRTSVHWGKHSIKRSKQKLCEIREFITVHMLPFKSTTLICETFIAQNVIIRMTMPSLCSLDFSLIKKNKVIKMCKFKPRCDSVSIEQQARAPPCGHNGYDDNHSFKCKTKNGVFIWGGEKYFWEF